MKIRRHYLALRRYYSHIHDDTPFETTTAELAEIIDCTHRNMVLLLRRMQDEQWLTWEAKRGRGNRSTLRFLATKEQIALQEAQELVDKQELHAALELLHTLEDGEAVKEQFQEWLSGQFGFHTEVQGAMRSDILRFPLPQTIHTLDPAAIHFTGESHLVSQLFDSLVRMDAKGKRIEPHLAHAWETDETRTIWTFYLRKGVLFHHGRQMVADDVRYSLERLKRLAPKGLYSWAYAAITQINVVDDYTVRIRLAARNEAFLAFLSTNRAAIVPQDIGETAGSAFGLQPIGTGPFRLAGSDHGIWQLEVFPGYFQGRGFLDRVEVWAIPEGDTAVRNVQLPTFQVMHNVRINSSAQQWQQVRQSGMTCKFITVNELKDGVLREERIRSAINAAIDRLQLLRLLSGDVIEAGDTFWPEDNKAGASGVPHSADPDRIRRELEEAGYRGETLVLATIPQYEADAQFIQQLCGDAGIPIVTKLIPADQFKGEARMSADLLLFAIMLDEHRELRLIDMYKSLLQHAVPDIQQWLEESLAVIMAEPDYETRALQFKAIEAALKSRSSLFFLYRKHLKTAFHPNVRGIALESLSWVRFRDLWFVPDEQRSS